MASTYRFLALGDEGREIARWFDKIQPAPLVTEKPRGRLLFFKADGDLDADPRLSPLVSIIVPEVRRGVLSTAGEVHFLTIGLARAFPRLEAIRKEFQNWLAQFELMFDGTPGPFDDYLLGSLRNVDSPIYALPGAREALSSGTYFIADDDSPTHVDRICRALALRGVACTDAG
jgi:hypothetical protein